MIQMLREANYGSIFSGIFNMNTSNQSSENNGNSTQKVKEKPKTKNKKRKFLDTYGSNLTTKAKNNQIIVIKMLFTINISCI